MRKKIELDRLEKMLHLEKAQAPVQFFDALKADLYAVPRNYFELAPDDLSLECKNEKEGCVVQMFCKAAGVKRLGGG